MTRDKRSDWVIPVLIALLTFVAFLPALHAGFVSWDDDKNFLANPSYRGLGLTQLRWMWTTFLLGHYVPLSWMTLGLDYSVWGMNPAGYHLTNVLLHSANAVLVYFLARRVLRLANEKGVILNEAKDLGQAEFPTARILRFAEDDRALAAAFAALLFAIHPLRVESVAWITERRDVLSEFFYLACVLCYLRWASAEAVEAHRRWYWLSVALLAFALLSKATPVTAPAVLLILNVYPLRRLGGASGWWSTGARRIYLELVPFALLAAGAAAMTFVALQQMAQLHPAQKVAVSAYSLAFYLWKTVAPVRLSPIYAMPDRIDPMDTIYLLSYAVAIAVCVVAWVQRRKWPGLAAGWLTFLAVIFPMLGFHQNGPQIAADRYTYHAGPVLAILAGAALFIILNAAKHTPSIRSSARGAEATRGLTVRMSLVLTAGVLLTLGALTWRQTEVWHDSTSLWSHVLALDSASAYGHNNWGNLLMQQGRVADATAQYQEAIAIAPNYAQAHNNLGIALARQGRLAEAIEHYERAIAIEPGYDEPQNNWGIAVVQQGDPSGAIDHYARALAINPNNADAQVNWGNALLRLGRADDAVTHYRAALAIRPDDADAHLNWGVALAQQSRFAEAIDQFRQALAIEPGQVEATQYLDRAMQLLNQRPPDDS